MLMLQYKCFWLKVRSKVIDQLYYPCSFPQALELRASCDCPALPATDPRAVFSKSVRLLLDSVKERESANKAKEREGKAAGAGSIFLPLPQAPSPTAQGPSTQLGGVLAPTPALSQALPSK